MKCDVCNQPRGGRLSLGGFMFEGTNEAGEKELRYICFECAAKRAEEEGEQHGTIDREDGDTDG